MNFLVLALAAFVWAVSAFQLITHFRHLEHR